MKDLLKTGNSLLDKPTNFSGAHLSDSQIALMNNITKANFNDLVHIDEQNKVKKSSFIDQLLQKLKLR